MKQGLGTGDVGKNCILDQEIWEYLVERVSFESRFERGEGVSQVDNQENRFQEKKEQGPKVLRVEYWSM